MIYSFSHRTDGPAFYWEWFLNRIRNQKVFVRNPYYPEKISEYDLSPDVCDGFTFTSKNYAPVVATPERICALESLIDTYPTLWSATINPYDCDIERHVAPIDDIIATTQTLSRYVTRERLTWQYSPITILDGRYTTEYHIRAFDDLARMLAPHVSRVSIDTLNVYRKVAANAPQLREPHAYELDEMIESFVKTAKREGIQIHACPAQHRLAHKGVDMSPCLSLTRFGEVNDVAVKSLKFAEGSGIYPACPAGCMTVRDLAPYNTCPHDCIYCYANKRPGIAADALRQPYNPESPILCDELRPSDWTSNAKPRIYRDRKRDQIAAAAAIK